MEKEKDINTYVTKKLVGDESFSELDFTLQEEFGFDYDDGGDFQTIEIGNGNTDDAFPILLDTLIGTLQEMKENGATHVEIEHHVDHIGYDISAYNIRKSTAEEIAALHTNTEKNKKIAELYAEIQKLERT